MPGVEDDGRESRRESAANRERVLTAATIALKRDGARVPLATIAADAGVGIATLYRNYPSREALLLALTDRSYRLILGEAQRAADSAAPAIECVGSFLEATLRLRADLVMPLLGGPVPLDEDAIALRATIQKALNRLVERGRRDGTVRRDVTGIDIIITSALLIQGLATAPEWDRMARRHASVYLDGLAEATATPLRDQALTGADLEDHLGRDDGHPPAS